MSQAPRRSEDTLTAAGAAWRDGLAPAVERFDLVEGRERLLAVQGSAASSSRRGRATLAMVLAASLAIGGGVFGWRVARRPAALAYVVEGASDQSGYVLFGPTSSERARPPATVRFSDGTVVEIAQGSRVRVAEVSPVGARIQVESGRASFRVAHRPGAQWTVLAGPYAVDVTGTSFDVDWRAEEPSFVVHLHEGSVRVRGPSAPLGVALARGQRLVARPGEEKLVLEPIERLPGAFSGHVDSAPAPETAPTDGSPNPATSEAASIPSATSALVLPGPAGSAPADTEPSWAQRVASGDFDGVLRAAESRGVETVLAAGTLGDLAALADAARLRGKTSLAKRALLAERGRFPGSAPARRAAFFLGRIAEDAEHAPSAAIGWYDTYLAESASGPYASEALGRKMLAVRTTQGVPAARSLAEQYLRRFPTGAYASPARALVEPPTP